MIEIASKVRRGLCCAPRVRRRGSIARSGRRRVGSRFAADARENVGVADRDQPVEPHDACATTRSRTAARRCASRARSSRRRTPGSRSRSPPPARGGRRRRGRAAPRCSAGRAASTGPATSDRERIHPTRPNPSPAVERPLSAAVRAPPAPPPTRVRCRSATSRRRTPHASDANSGRNAGTKAARTPGGGDATRRAAQQCAARSRQRAAPATRVPSPIAVEIRNAGVVAARCRSTDRERLDRFDRRYRGTASRPTMPPIRFRGDDRQRGTASLSELPRAVTPRKIRLHARRALAARADVGTSSRACSAVRSPLALPASRRG